MPGKRARALYEPVVFEIADMLDVDKHAYAAIAAAITRMGEAAIRTITFDIVRSSRRPSDRYQRFVQATRVVVRKPAHQQTKLPSVRGDEIDPELDQLMRRPPRPQ